MIILEMKNAHLVFEVHKDNLKDLVEYREIDYHIIFDIKLDENFSRKDRLVTSEHEINMPLIMY